MTEAEVAAACDALADATGWRVERYEQRRATRITEGLPDRRYWHPRGRRLWVELKAPGGKLTRDQHQWLLTELHADTHALAVDDPAQLRHVLQLLARDIGRGAALDYCRSVTAQIAARGYRGERVVTRRPIPSGARVRPATIGPHWAHCTYSLMDAAKRDPEPNEGV